MQYFKKNIPALTKRFFILLYKMYKKYSQFYIKNSRFLHKKIKAKKYMFPSP